jgi:hypothetical protein
MPSPTSSSLLFLSVLGFAGVFLAVVGSGSIFTSPMALAVAARGFPNASPALDLGLVDVSAVRDQTLSIVFAFGLVLLVAGSIRRQRRAPAARIESLQGQVVRMKGTHSK